MYLAFDLQSHPLSTRFNDLMETSRSLASPEKGRSVNMLIRKARGLRTTAVADASGRCFALSLEVAALARTLGFDLQLIVWRVVGDPDFVEHWAVAIDGSQVIDPTRVQVDGLTDLVCAIDSYPENYVRPRLYPSALLLEGRNGTPSGAKGKHLHQFLWMARWRLFRYDMRRHLHMKHFGGSVQVLMSMLRFCVTSSLTQLQSQLESRRRGLTVRVREQLRAQP